MRKTASTKRRTRLVANDRGRRVGEAHPRASLTDHEVDLIRELSEEGSMTGSELARKFDTTRQNIHLIVTYQRRAHTAST